jgi:hypothetical protein
MMSAGTSDLPIQAILRCGGVSCQRRRKRFLIFYAVAKLASCTWDLQVWVASLPSRYSEGKSHGQSAQLETCEEEQRRTLREKPGSGRWKTTIMITMTMSMISWNFPLVFLS